MKIVPILFNIILSGITSAWLLACSEATNPLGYMVPDGYKASHEYLLAQANIYLNYGDYDKAREFGEEAYKLDPGSEEGALVLGFAYLSLAGMSTFDLAIKLQEDGKDEASLAEGSSNPLASLKTLLGLDEGTFASLTVEGNRVTLENGTVVEGAPSSGVFQSLPVLIPKTAEEARASGSEVLKLLAQAVEVVCPFVAEEAKVLSPVEDPRHGVEACPPSPKDRYFGGRIHFLWSLAHLTEAIAFNNIVLYDPDGDGANLIKRSSLLSDSTSLSITDYITAVQDLSVTLEQILPTDAEKSKSSMLIGMVNDLEATNKGFSLLPGMPENMTKSISEAITKINTQREALKGATEGLSDEAAGSQALKEQLTSELASNLKTQIESKVEAGDLSAEQTTELCASYATISTDTIDACN